LTDVLNKQSQTKQDKLDKNALKNVKPHDYHSGNQNVTNYLQSHQFLIPLAQL